MKRMIYSGSPHVRANDNTKKIMLNVTIALLPASVMAVVYFGLSALFVLAVSVLSAVMAEIIYLLIRKMSFKDALKQFDFTTVVTGLLIGLNMPPLAFSAWYVPVLASVFAIIVVKMLFGGTGCNIANPAITGRIFVVMSFGVLMNTWSYPLIGLLSGNEIQVVTGATPLTEMLTHPTGSGVLLTMGYSNLDLLLGTGLPGCIGETSKLALIVGGIYLVATKVLNFRWPLVYIGVTGLFTVALNGFDFSYFLPSILSGGLMIGAIFMATDYVTTPNTKIGNYVYFAALGLLTAGLRQATGGEAVSFSILLMNLFVPLVDKYIVPKPFGYRKEKKEAAK
ncbi:MAG TPA: RnfABCDGE type electron transport complex subunit D [Clostridia bacterium]|nr:RnfABCDGE type electron transport complex subunit D [Clostridia bacterium]